MPRLPKQFSQKKCRKSQGVRRQELSRTMKSLPFAPVVPGPPCFPAAFPLPPPGPGGRRTRVAPGPLRPRTRHPRPSCSTRSGNHASTCLNLQHSENLGDALHIEQTLVPRADAICFACRIAHFYFSIQCAADLDLSITPAAHSSQGALAPVLSRRNVPGACPVCSAPSRQKKTNKK